MLNSPKVDMNKPRGQLLHTPFYILVTHGHFELVEGFLEDSKIDITKRTFSKDVSWNAALREEHYSIFRSIFRKIDINVSYDSHYPMFI